MESTHILIAVLSLVTLFLTPYIINLWRFMRKVMKIPSTKSHFIFGHLHEVLFSGLPRGQMVETLLAVVNRCPPVSIIWFGPMPYIILRKPEYIKIIMNNPKCMEKTLVHDLLVPWLGTGLLLSKGAKWHSRRKMITPAFHFSILERFVSVFAEKSQILVKKLNQEIGSKSSNIFPYITLCSFDIICESSMGIKMNAQEQEENSEYVNTVFRLTNLVTKRMFSPWFYPDFIFSLTSDGRQFKKDVNAVHKISTQVIRERRKVYEQIKEKEINENEDTAGKKRRLAFLDLLLESSDCGKNFTDEDIREEVDTFMFEGHDTTTSGTCFTLHMLANHPDVQGKVYEELENIFQGSDRAPSIKDLNEMKYLERVIKETLRLYPSVPLVGRLVSEDIEIDGHVIPAGMNVGLSIHLAHRDPEYFPNPNSFNPDNFLPEKVAERHPYAYIPFSAGPRNCIGQKFALLEMKTIISYVIRHYKLRSLADPVLQLNIVAKTINGFNIGITNRHNKEQVD